jgi:hypothetical protein
MDEQKALSWQALYDNMWGIFALGLLLPILIFTVWGIVEIINVPQLDVNSAMQSLQPAQQAATAEIPATEASPVH